MNTLRAHLQLMRLPAVFTAMADVFMGFVLAGHTFGGFDRQRVAGFSLLLAASSCLYLAGMVLNDYFDRAVDAVDRPGRPIPSGRVPANTAAILGVVLIAAGLAAAFAAGRLSLMVAVILALCVFLYDAALKKTFLGPVAMGACRSLNILLGASFAPAGAITILMARPQVPVAIAMGIYIAGVTWFARQEAKTSDRRQLIGAATVINLGLAALIGRMIITSTGVPGMIPPRFPPSGTSPGGVVFALAIIALILNRRLFGAIFTPSPEKVQPAVKTLLLSIIFIDAVHVFYQTGNQMYAIAAAALIVPALLLGRWVFVT